MKDETQSCLTPRSWSWPLRQDASLQLEQVKEELSPGGVRGEAKGLTLNKPYFPKSRETEQIASMACGNLLGFFFFFCWRPPLSKLVSLLEEQVEKVEPTPVYVPAGYTQQSGPRGK